MTKWNEAFWVVESWVTFRDVHQLWIPVDKFEKMKSYNKAYVDLFWVNMKEMWTESKIV